MSDKCHENCVGKQMCTKLIKQSQIELLDKARNEITTKLLERGFVEIDTEEVWETAANKSDVLKGFKIPSCIVNEVFNSLKSELENSHE